jgi:uncharacterized protein YciI
MPQYLVLADDHTDAETINRRLFVRGAHLTRLSTEKARGRFIFGGAKLSAEGKMIGSMLVINAENETAAREWLQADPYTQGRVWQSVQVLLFKVADMPLPATE